jgi:C1A family cysteine protease
MKYTALFAFALIGLVAASQLHATKDAFLSFQRKFKKTYASQEEFSQRFQIFQENMKIAAEHQARNPKARFGVTKFSDLTTEEFSKLYLMPEADFKNKWVHPAPKNFTIRDNLRGPTPDRTNWDWSTKGYTTPVKNQGQCGSCWAFSATETIESQVYICTGKLPVLAPEQIVDCDTAGQDQGCNGGFPSGAYEYVQSAGGMDTEASYPYTAGESGEGGNCAFDATKVAAKITGYKSVNGESGLYTQLSTSGPASICVDASSWQTYSGGVLTDCGSDVDHCVQLTGYANYNKQGAYWIVRNSWGTDWGENGFIWVAIGQDLCAIGDYATVVTC